MNIEGISSEIIESNGAISGQSIMKAKDAFVEQVIDTNNVKMIILENAAVVIESLSENDSLTLKDKSSSLLVAEGSEEYPANTECLFSASGWKKDRLQVHGRLDRNR